MAESPPRYSAAVKIQARRKSKSVSRPRFSCGCTPDNSQRIRLAAALNSDDNECALNARGRSEGGAHRHREYPATFRNISEEFP